MLLPLIPIEEQKALATYIDGEVSRLDGLVAESENVIRLLQERRTALISAAVTGQIDVRAYRPAAEPVAA